LISPALLENKQRPREEKRKEVKERTEGVRKTSCTGIPFFFYIKKFGIKVISFSFLGGYLTAI